MKLQHSIRNSQSAVSSASLVGVVATCLLGVGIGGEWSQAAAAAEPPVASGDPRNGADKPSGEGQAKAEEAPPAIPADGSGTREEQFAEYMTGATLAGRFTVVGKDNDEMPEEEYTISKCEKLPEGDLYRFTARIRYGDTDVELPMDLPVHWAGDTPVITLTNLWIPGLGTFSSRVLIYRGQYAGTWSHGEVGGHLFGVIKKEE